MRWSFKWRKQLKSGLYYDLLQKGFLKPEDLEPDVTGFDFYLDAFEELSTARQVGMTVGPIPFTAIVEYLRIYELSDFDDFAYIIRRLDSVFLELNSAATETAAPDKASKKSGSKGASTNSDKKNHNQGRHGRQ